MNAVRPYTFALIVVCVVAASTVFQLQQLLKSSCASSKTDVPSVNTHSQSESRVHSAGLCTADPLGLSTHRTKSDIRLGVILRPHSFKLSKSLLKQTDQIIKQTVCHAHPFLTDPGECIQSVLVDYFVSTDSPFYAHERIHKLPSSRCSTDCHPSIEWLDRNKKYFAHMDAVIFEGVLQPNQKQSGLSQLPLHHPSGPVPSPSYLSTNSSVYLLTLQPTLESQWTHTEMDSSRHFSSKPARWPSASHTNRTAATAHKGLAAKQAPPVPSDSWVDQFMSILDALVFGFDVESADAFGYDDTPTHSEEEDTPSLKPFQSPSEPGPDRNTDRDEDTEIDTEIAYAPDMSGDQFQWLLRVVVMVAWLHMFWDQL